MTRRRTSAEVQAARRDGQVRQQGFDDGYAGRDLRQDNPVYWAAYARGKAAKARDAQEAGAA